MSSPIKKTLLQPSMSSSTGAQIELDELTSLLDPSKSKTQNKLTINALRKRSGSIVEASESVDVNVKLYMTKIGQVELLSKEREQEIGKEIEVARQGILTTLMSLPYGLRLVVDVQKQLEKEQLAPTSRSTEGHSSQASQPSEQPERSLKELRMIPLMGW